MVVQLELVSDFRVSWATVTIALAYGVGSRDELVDQAGITHLLEHLLLSSRSRRYRLPVEEWAAKVGGESGGLTGPEEMVIWGRVPVERGVELCSRLFDAATDTRFGSGDVERERAVVLDELGAASRDRYEKAIEQSYRAVFGHSSLARPVGGSDRSVRGISGEALFSWQAELVGANAMAMAVVGEENTVRLVSTVAEELATCRSACERVDRNSNRPSLSNRVTDWSSPVFRSARGYVMMSAAADLYRGAPRGGLEVVAELLSESPGSLLANGLKNRGVNVYDWWSVYTSYADCGMLQIGAECSKGDVASIVREVKSTLMAMSDGTVGAREVRSARERVAARLRLAAEDPVARAVSLATSQASGLGDPLQVIEEVATITPHLTRTVAANLLETMVITSS
jgi:predicted Zn-dependent peptidase